VKIVAPLLTALGARPAEQPLDVLVHDLLGNGLIGQRGLKSADARGVTEPTIEKRLTPGEDPAAARRALREHNASRALRPNLWLIWQYRCGAR
jgi:hypothetical protein